MTHHDASRAPRGRRSRWVRNGFGGFVFLDCFVEGKRFMGLFGVFCVPGSSGRGTPGERMTHLGTSGDAAVADEEASGWGAWCHLNSG
jgi:hypothetical protein